MLLRKKGNRIRFKLLPCSLITKPSLIFLFGLSVFAGIKANASSFQSIAQKDDPIVGKVTDAFDDTPIPGVVVHIAGTSQGTTTDDDGAYTLPANQGDTLIFTFVGYESQKIAVGDSKIINVRLSKASKSLGETVVVAFGTQSKESVVSSITTVDVKDLRTPSSNLTTALAGKMAGLIAYQSTGAPGEEDAQFFIRSVTSFGSGLTAPLILIDNIEVTSKELSRLNPDDIASFSILKDASATALYGARGANGVVLVTTKEGENSKVKVSLNMYRTILMQKQVAMSPTLIYHP